MLPLLQVTSCPACRRAAPRRQLHATTCTPPAAPRHLQTSVPSCLPGLPRCTPAPRRWPGPPRHAAQHRNAGPAPTCRPPPGRIPWRPGNTSAERCRVAPLCPRARAVPRRATGAAKAPAAAVRAQRRWVYQQRVHSAAACTRSGSSTPACIRTSTHGPSSTAPPSHQSTASTLYRLYSLPPLLSTASTASTRLYRLYPSHRPRLYPFHRRGPAPTPCPRLVRAAGRRQSVSSLQSVSSWAAGSHWWTSCPARRRAASSRQPAVSSLPPPYHAARPAGHVPAAGPSSLSALRQAIRDSPGAGGAMPRSM
jgi:hypothetical protein